MYDVLKDIQGLFDVCTIRVCSRAFLTLCVVSLSSYLHCEWAVEQQLEKDKRIQQKIKRFKIKQAQRAHFFADVRPFHTSVCVCESVCVCVCLFSTGVFACISVVCFRP